MLVLGVAISSLGCRASADDCREVAQHIVELGQAEGKLNASSADELEQTCAEQRPTRALVQCMLAAQSLAELEGC
ncbi:hypothetical protein ENSA7_25960 [Enhygromyxa salina]|uniref:Uncharacterized protein n=1 Tax=Enhygromyxa salina TaxID=215803 RepID=A0A2S9YR96_9BACT|nr:hypothetical protein ENSA7_25960 [Enhygromyxa salina]